MTAPTCICGAPMVQRRTDKFGGKVFWGCSSYPACKEIHGAHQATGEPLGIPADKPTRAARSRAHAAFDTLWQGGAMKRKAAYRWMGEALGLPREECHISRMDIASCERLIAAVEARRTSCP